MKVTIAFYPNGAEYHAEGCTSRKRNLCETRATEMTPAEVVEMNAEIAAECAELNIPRSEMQTRMHPCLMREARAQVKAAAVAS